LGVLITVEEVEEKMIIISREMSSVIKKREVIVNATSLIFPVIFFIE